MTPTLIPQDWVNVECEDCSGLDKISRHPPPPPKQQRTHSTPLLDSRDATTLPHKKVIMMKELLTESCRSISDPDLISSVDKERSSVSSAEADMETSTGHAELRTSIRGEKVGVIKLPFNVRYSDNSLERSEVRKMLDGMEEHGVTANGRTSGGKWKDVLLSKSRHNKPKHLKDLQKAKKNKAFLSSDNFLEQSGSSVLDKEERRSSSGSPQEIRSPVPKKKNGTGIFKIKKKKHSLPLRPTPSPLEDLFSKETSNSPPAIMGGLGSENGHVIANEMVSTGILAEESPRHHVVSLPVRSVEEGVTQEPDANFNLQTLVLPVNKNWTKCGYLWLRMKLPNGRYAWTHIVSLF